MTTGPGREAEAEQQPYGVHLPRLGEAAGDPAEDAVDEAAVVEVLLEL